jgi:uncharacterized membrane protein
VTPDLALEPRLEPAVRRSWTQPNIPRRWAVPWASALGLFLIYATVSVQRQRQMLTSGYDMGIFEQEVRSYAAGHWPTSTLKGPGFPLLGDHFSPIVAGIAPFYRLFPSADTLLVVQAALLAVAVVPISLWARSELGRLAAAIVTVGYGLSWGIAQTVGFDFHEVAFAVPLVAFAAVAFAKGQLRAAVLWSVPLVLVKEDLGLTVAVMGLLVAWRGARLLGLSTAVAGVVASWLEIEVIIPHINPLGHNPHHGNFKSGLWHEFSTILIPDTKIATIVLLLLPAAFIAHRSPVLLLGLPTLLWRFLSNDPTYWGVTDHYSAILMPIVFVAYVDALRRVRRPRRIGLLAVTLIVTAALVPSNPLWSIRSPSFWHRDQKVLSADRLLARIPAGVTVSASNSLAAQLTHRDDVSLFGHTSLSVSQAQYVIVDTHERITFPLNSSQQLEQLAEAVAAGYTQLDAADGIVLLRRS